MGRFETSLLNEGHVSTHEGCGTSAYTLPTMTIPTSSVTSTTNVTTIPTLTQEGLPIGHCDNDSSDDEYSSTME
jgi:hypothetical protein